MTNAPRRDPSINDESPTVRVTPRETAASAREVRAEQGVAWSARQPAATASTNFHRDIGGPDPAIKTQAAPAWAKGPGSASVGIDQTGNAIVEQAPRWVWEIRPNRDEALIPITPRVGDGRSAWFFRCVLLAALALGWIGGSNSHIAFDFNRPEIDGKAVLNAVVERIIHAESDGDLNPKKKRSSATGAGQFLDGTWLELIKVHRPH